MAMKKAILFAALSVFLTMTGCYEDYYYDESETTAVSQTTTTTESAEEEISISEGLSDESTYIEDSSGMMPPEDAPEWTEDAPEQSEETAEEPPSETEDSTETTGSETTMTETTTTADTAEPAKTEQPSETAVTTQSTAPETLTEPVPTEAPTEPSARLEHDGTDYGKALAVYEYIRQNGYGTCVNYACQTYDVCKEVGLPCYLVWTEAGIYGHVANTVCVNGIWFIMDTQGGFFLSYNYGFTEVVNRDESHIGDAGMLSNYSYEELFG